ncbi:MAG: type III polyketide synthase [Acidobacteria bacterium]|nr:type III polyketide synthase [Acidobacteriota bacterium]MBI3664508.1 type III polyketide synthase [Acidobacteriota bacterium]
MSIAEGALVLSPESLTRCAAPVLLSCSTAVPPRRFSQEEAFSLCGYSSSRIRQIFLNSDIDFRHFWLDPAGFAPNETPDQLHARYLEGARHLAGLAARRALDQARFSPAGIDCILVASCTGYLCPDLSTLLVSDLGLRRDIQRGALLGHGCAGALPLLQRASDHARANPGSRVLAVAVEICSACYFFDTSMETIIGNAICADGAAAFVLSASGNATPAQDGSGAAPPPCVLGFQSILDPAQLDKVGFEHRDGRLRIVLAAEIRDLAGPIINRCLDSLLLPRGLRRSDIRFWILHPGGRKVLDAASEFLGLAEEQLRFSRRVLRDFGNMSSPTVLFVLDSVRRSGEPRPGDYGVLLALGPGFAAEAALLRW